VKKHRGLKKEKGRYFGPFASAGSVNRTLNQLQKAFLLRSCSDSVFESRTRPCLLYQIKRCSAPCVGYIDEGGYAALVEDATEFLLGKSTKVQAQLAQAMAAASGSMEFERAAALRDRIRALTNVQGSQSVNPQSVAEADVVALHQDGGHACVEVFFIRANQNWGNRAYFPRTGAGAEPGELLAAFLVQFYANKTPARLVLLSHPVDDADLIEEALTAQLGRRVELAVPQRGEKATLVAHAARNAREALARRMAETREPGGAARGPGEAFGLEAAPERVEVYDNSHIQGANAVGAMIVAGSGGLREVAVPEVQHPRGQDRAGRRLRDDARSAGAPLRAADQGGPGPPGRDLARPRADRRRRGAGRRGARDARRARHRGRGAGRRRQGRGPRRRQARCSTASGARPWRCPTATPCSTSSSACATRRTASRSARTGLAARRRPGRRRSTRCRGWVRQESAPCSPTSARRRR
jgi:hypothetical protein